MKVAVITGGSDGIGKALALELAAKDIKVFIGGRNKSKLAATQKAYPQFINVIPADISLDSDRKYFVEQLVNEKKIDFLIHNAATETPVKPFTDISLKEWRYSFSVNTEAPLFLTQMLLNKLKKGGRVLMISSGLAHFPLPGLLAYCASKAALHMIYQGLNTELNSQGIYVASVSPGVVDTQMQTRLRENKSTKFSSLNVFKQFNENQKLRDPQLVAKDLTRILLNTDDDKFSREEWNL